MTKIIGLQRQRPHLELRNQINSFPLRFSHTIISKVPFQTGYECTYYLGERRTDSGVSGVHVKTNSCTDRKTSEVKGQIVNRYKLCATLVVVAGMCW